MLFKKMSYLKIKQKGIHKIFSYISTLLRIFYEYIYIYIYIPSRLSMIQCFK